MIAQRRLAIRMRRTAARRLLPAVFLFPCVVFICGTVRAASIASWGGGGAERADAPAGDYVRICAGAYHNLALTSDGRLVAWGEWVNGQCNAPPDGEFVAIAAGYYHNLALRADGTVAAWGNNWRGQCDVPRGGHFRTIVAGNWHSLAIRSDGSLAAWGWNEQGQCDTPPGNDYVAVCGGHYHSLALTVDGSIVAWGGNGDGQCDVPAGHDFVAVAAGALHSLALRKDGSLVAWGRNDYGQCDVPNGSDFVSIASQSFHNIALRSDGSVAAWGYDRYGQCDSPQGEAFVEIAAGGFHCLALKPHLVEEPAAQPEKSERADVPPGDAPADAATTSAHVAQTAHDSNEVAQPALQPPAESQADLTPTLASEPDLQQTAEPVTPDPAIRTVETPVRPLVSAALDGEEVAPAARDEPRPLAAAAQYSENFRPLPSYSESLTGQDAIRPRFPELAVETLDLVPEGEHRGGPALRHWLVAGGMVFGLIVLSLAIFVRRRHLFARFLDMRAWHNMTTHRDY